MELSQVFRRFAVPEQAERLAGASSPLKFHPKGDYLIREGDRVHALCILVEGVAHACRTMPGGMQQTLALCVPGDVLDSKAYVLDRSSVSIRAATAVKIVQIPRQRLDDLIDSNPADARWLLAVLASDNAILEEWAIGMGRRSAYQQLAHLLCEIAARMRGADLASDEACAFPLTQADLADVLGLSVVHVNRMLQQLRGDGLIELRQGRLKVLDRRRLVDAADFDAEYLGARVGARGRG
jgi:CRP-like cAMP-binding protein